MPKGKHNISKMSLPTDQLTATEVSSILSIHRNTLQRMASTLLLPPDGKTGGGRSFWLRASVDAYRLGTLTSATIWYISESPIVEINLKIKSGHRILGQSVASVPLTGTTRTESLGSLLSFLATAGLHALALPAESNGTNVHKVLADACRESGIPLILYPG